MIVLSSALVLPACGAPKMVRGQLDSITMPAGFSIDLYARADGVRSLTLGPDGIVFAGSRGTGNVYAIVDANKDGRAERVHVIARDLNQPNGVAYRDGALYIAEISRVLRIDDIAKKIGNPPKPVVVFDGYPTDQHHGWKFIAFGPDGRLYVPVGAPCNVCDEDNPVYASITRLDPAGTNMEVFARGIRNTVGFDWHPETGELWFTDNGRDWLGDNAPSDELNHAPERGLHFGFPYCHAGTISDPDFGADHPCSDYRPPARKLGPHVASLGMRFYTGSMFPEAYRGKIFIAEHGSWNRSEKIGYRVTIVDPDTKSYDVFAEGWMDDGDVWGRPVDVLVMPDGALLISDDKAGAVYRVTYRD